MRFRLAVFAVHLDEDVGVGAGSLHVSRPHSHLVRDLCVQNAKILLHCLKRRAASYKRRVNSRWMNINKCCWHKRHTRSKVRYFTRGEQDKETQKKDGSGKSNGWSYRQQTLRETITSSCLYIGTTQISQIVSFSLHSQISPDFMCAFHMCAHIKSSCHVHTEVEVWVKNLFFSSIYGWHNSLTKLYTPVCPATPRVMRDGERERET